MMKEIKLIGQIGIAVLLTLALIFLTLEKIIPHEVFVGFAGAAFTWLFKGWEQRKKDV